MSSNTPRNAVARQWEVLKLLSSRSQGATAARLRLDLRDQGYTVTKRTVERDLEGLEPLFPITHGEEQPYQWHWVKGASTLLSALSLPEALSAHLLGRYLRPLLPASMVQPIEPLLESAAAKLGGAQRDNYLARWADRVAVVPPALATLPPKVNLEVLDTVQRALLHGSAVEVDYQRAGGSRAKRYVLYPHGLVISGPVTYLIASSENGPEPWPFALHRMKAARPSYEPFRAIDGFSLQQYIAAGGMQFGGGEIAKFSARVSSMLLDQLLESPLTADQTIKSKGEVHTVTATLPISWRLKWWVLSKSGDIEVVLPRAFRQEVADVLANGAMTYSNTRKKK
jgi:predicted DNA-binding transcriptional regulator YafY